MNKVETKYTHDLGKNEDENEDMVDESITIIVNEEYPELIQVHFFQERWRTKKEYKKLLTEMIETIDLI